MAAEVLSWNAHLLPTTGRALDFACGRGGNALFLAKRGLDVEAWDLNPEALALLDEASARLGLAVVTQRRDVEQNPPAADSFAVICVSHFLYRPICAALVAALKPGGLLFYQTFTDARLPESGGPRRSEYRLQPNELLKLFSPLQLISYREEGLVGDLAKGWRNKALLVGQKRA
ncbi:MAG: class I SAM-dependent methyltransferase [Gammaproteobacteria bacterium]|nr:class I SAM-dependent methyltransferase [Gammaproteobacteria bacterium]